MEGAKGIREVARRQLDDHGEQRTEIQSKADIIEGGIYLGITGEVRR